jgi:hypothetical protein
MDVNENLIRIFRELEMKNIIEMCSNNWNLTRIIVDDMFIYKTLMDDLFAEQEYNPETKNGDSK